MRTSPRRTASSPGSSTRPATRCRKAPNCFASTHRRREMALPQRVRVVEVGPRDGLQAEPTTVPAAAKIALIDALSAAGLPAVEARSEEHTSELQSLMRISYAVFCLKKKNKKDRHFNNHRRRIM